MLERRPVEIDVTLLDSAERSGSAAGRSASEQLARWARVGRALDVAGLVSIDLVEAGLSAGVPYDDLDTEAQALVRDQWPEWIEAGRAARPGERVQGTGPFILRARRGWECRRASSSVRTRGPVDFSHL